MGISEGKRIRLGDWVHAAETFPIAFLDKKLYVFRLLFLAAILGDLRLKSVDEFIHLRGFLNFVSVDDLAWSVSSV